MQRLFLLTLLGLCPVFGGCVSIELKFETAVRTVHHHHHSNNRCEERRAKAKTKPESATPLPALVSSELSFRYAEEGVARTSTTSRVEDLLSLVVKPGNIEEDREEEGAEE